MLLLLCAYGLSERSSYAVRTLGLLHHGQAALRSSMELLTSYDCMDITSLSPCRRSLLVYIVNYQTLIRTSHTSQSHTSHYQKATDEKRHLKPDNKLNGHWGFLMPAEIVDIIIETLLVFRRGGCTRNNPWIIQFHGLGLWRQ